MQGLLCGAKFGLRADYRKYLSIRMDHLAGQIALICVWPKFLLHLLQPLLLYEYFSILKINFLMFLPWTRL